MKDKKIVIDNPSNLPLLPLDDFVLFQEDLKKPIDEKRLMKLMRSILDHHVFIAKAVFFEDGMAYTEDGHQTLIALKKLRENGYTESEVITYEMKDGRMQVAKAETIDGIVVPYQTIVPAGDTPEKRKKDAVEKLLQINSQYAEINPETSLFKSLAFDLNELDDVLSKIEIPGLDVDFVGSGSELRDEMDEFNDQNCLYPIVPKFAEHYDAVIIVSDNKIDTAHLEEILKITKNQTYRENKLTGKGMVITAKRLFELWSKR